MSIPGTDIEKGTVSVEVETPSVVTDNEKLTGHVNLPSVMTVAKQIG